MQFSELQATCQLEHDCPGCPASSECPVGLNQCSTSGCTSCEHRDECPVFHLSSTEE